jgi:hypothetical protein
MAENKINLKPELQEAPPCVEREIVTSGIKIHIKSIFSGQTSLDDALEKIITRKLANTKD